MFQISLKNNKFFLCDKDTTIFQAAKNANIFLEHSCLTARCRSCIVKIKEGETVNNQEELVLSETEKAENFVLSCNAKPISDLLLDVEDLGNIVLHDKKIVPSKIDTIEYVTKDVLKIIVRLPPTANFNFVSGQYVNIIKGSLNRSYSIANMSGDNSKLTFYIKKYETGLMSEYWFNQAKANDLIRLEGPLGSFFFRKSTKKNIVFLATGTGIAPIKAILEQIETSKEDYSDKKILLLVGARKEEDFFWIPEIKSNIQVEYIPVLSRSNENWIGKKGYVQNILLEQKVDLTNAQIYACGSNEMIESARKLLIENSLPANQFYSDAFICTN